MTPHRLSRVQGLALASVMVFAGVIEAPAQVLPMPGQSAPAAQFPAPGQSTAFPPPPGPSTAFPLPGHSSTPYPSGSSHGAAPTVRPPGVADQSVCAQFPSLKEDVEKGAAAIRAASERKAPREEACPLFKSFVLKEARMIKFLETNRTVCGVPPNIITQVKGNHAGAIRVRNQLCSAGPVAPAGPSLSDAFGGPIIADDTGTKKGHGIFDTLTGSPLAR
jgi:hypothetical protein